MDTGNKSNDRSKYSDCDKLTADKRSGEGNTKNGRTRTEEEEIDVSL